jgi:hypothetical protein
MPYPPLQPVAVAVYGQPATQTLRGVLGLAQQRGWPVWQQPDRPALLRDLTRFGTQTLVLCLGPDAKGQRMLEVLARWWRPMHKLVVLIADAVGLEPAVRRLQPTACLVQPSAESLQTVIDRLQQTPPPGTKPRQTPDLLPLPSARPTPARRFPPPRKLAPGKWAPSTPGTPGDPTFLPPSTVASAHPAAPVS